MLAFIDNLRLALATFVGNPLRSLLTLLGIVIGVATVICMMGLIEGLRLKVSHDLSSLGADTFQLNKRPSGFHRGNWQKYAKRPNLTLADRQAIVASCPSVRAASASDTAHGQKLATAIEETRPNVTVVGATPEYADTSGTVVAAGRFMGDTDEVDRRRVAVIGLDVVDTLFPGRDPVGEELRVKGRPFLVIGVLQRRGSFLGFASLDNRIIIPMSTFADLYGQSRSVTLNVQAVSPELLDRAQDEVTVLMRRRHDLTPDAANDFEVATNESMTRTFNNLSQVITVATFGVCLLSLVVGGIGILNIMLMSVTERVREIGVRKALGARRRRILAQFATEAVALSLIGGVIGVAVGFLLAFLARWVFAFTVSVPTWAVVLSLAMSSLVGLVFGIYPAARAARLDPVEAMRAE